MLKELCKYAFVDPLADVYLIPFMRYLKTDKEKGITMGKITIGVLLLTLLVLGACGAAGEETTESKEAMEDNASEKENEEKEAQTISNMEAMPFEEVEGKTAVKLYTADWSDPYDLEELRWKIYYGDNEFITATPDEGIFRYDLNNDQVVWESELTATDTVMHDGLLYATQVEESKSFANIGAMNPEDGSIEKMYEEKDYRVAGRLHFSNDLMVFTGANLETADTENSKEWIVYDKNTGTKKWTTPIAGSYHNYTLDTGAGVLFMDDEESVDDAFLPDEVAYIHDKETGEELETIQVKAINQTPVMNKEGIYFADFRENLIQLYDHDGNLKEELQPEIGFGIYQLIQPIATDEAFIYADNEGIVWYDPDLSEMQHRVELGESTIRYMEATDTLVYAIISEETEEGEKEFFTVSLDIQMGEVYEKIALETNDNTVRAQHVYNNKYHFAVVDPEKQREVYYVFGEDVNKPMTE